MQPKSRGPVQPLDENGDEEKAVRWPDGPRASEEDPAVRDLVGSMHQRFDPYTADDAPFGGKVYVEADDLSGTRDAGTTVPGMARYETVTVDDRLRLNAEALKELDAVGAQEYFEKLQEEDPVFVDADETELCVCCIDERQIEGKAVGSAGVGVLMNPAQRRAAAGAIMDRVEAMLERNGRKKVKVKAKPHKAGKCGAAAKARADAGEKDMSPEAIDGTAGQAGDDLCAEILSVAAERGLQDLVEVESSAYPEETFLQSHNHPGGGAIVNYDATKVLNQSRKKGPMLYNVAVLGDDKVAMHDAFLAAMIALGGHGMFHGPEGIELPDGLRFRIVIAAPADRVAGLKATYETERDTNPKYEALRDRVIIDTWARG